LIKTGQKIPEIRFSFSLSGGSSSFFSSLFSDFSLLFAAAKGRVIKPYSPKWASPYGLIFGHVWVILYLGGKPNPTNLPLPD
jgi:tryptophan-rich sensory protein